MKLSIFKQTRVRVPRERLHRLFAHVSRTEGRRRGGVVNLVFVTDAQMKKLNSRFRGINRTTDVLSFNIDDEATDGEVFGEVYISVPQADRQAKQIGHSAWEEYLRLACHGFLHLFGYDHEKTDEEALMRSREDKYLAGLRKEAVR